MILGKTSAEARFGRSKYEANTSAEAEKKLQPKPKLRSYTSINLGSNKLIYSFNYWFIVFVLESLQKLRMQNFTVFGKNYR